MKPVLFCLDDNNELWNSLCQHLDAEKGDLEYREFPDGESYLNVLSHCDNRPCYILCNLHQPNGKFLPLVFLADNLKDQGATEVGLIAPYLAYMRQDIRFNPGEALTSKTFAAILSRSVDWLVTADPHLHRYHSLSEIYSIPAKALHASEVIARWIAQAIDNPIIIGPDEESQQWVSSVADHIGCPAVVLNKIRHGDREVDISVPDVEQYLQYTPILVDDIISSGKTMMETAKHIINAGMSKPIAIGVHAVFNDEDYTQLLENGCSKVVTCNAIVHQSNGIDLAELFVQGIKTLHS